MHNLTLDIWDAGAWLTAAQLAGVVITAYIAILWIAIILWTLRDIRARTSDRALQTLSVAVVAAFFVPGLLLYLAMRPNDTLADEYERRLESEAFLREIQKQPACPSCRRSITADFRICPYCRTTLRVPCDSCNQYLAMDWTICPYCTAERVPAYAGAPDYRRGARTQPAATVRRRDLDGDGRTGDAATGDGRTANGRTADVRTGDGRTADGRTVDGRRPPASGAGRPRIQTRN